MNKEKKTLFEHLGVNTKKGSSPFDKVDVDRELLTKTIKSLVVFLIIGFLIGFIIEMFIAAPFSIVFVLVFAIVWLLKKFGDDIF